MPSFTAKEHLEFFEENTYDDADYYSVSLKPRKGKSFSKKESKQKSQNRPKTMTTLSQMEKRIKN